MRYKSNNRFINFVLWRIWDLCQYLEALRCKLQTDALYAKGAAQKPHTLPGELIVSLTSHPPRFKFVETTLKCLLTQSVKPDRIILWITAKDIDKVTPAMLAMKERGLEIHPYEHRIGPYTKFIPTLENFPDAFVATADDDIYYPRDWLERLIAAWDGGKDHVVAHWGAYIPLDDSGHPLSAEVWSENIEDNPDRRRYFLPWGESGILYPPHIFHGDLLSREKFMRLADSSDDYWFYWMARLNGVRHTKIKGDWKRINWPGSQQFGLWKKPQIHDENDRRIRNMVAAYGFPAYFPAA